MEINKLKNIVASGTVTASARAIIDKDFKAEQQDKSKEIKSIATSLAMGEMKLNRWSGSEDDWETVYKTVWLEKLMFVQLTYDVSEILSLSRQLLDGQKSMITYLGIIVSNQGEILKNQKIIITNQGLILDVTNAIYEDVKEIKATTENILGTVQDIQGSVNDIKANGVKVISNDYSPGVAKFSKYLGIIAGVLGVIILLVIVLRIVKRKNK